MKDGVCVAVGTGGSGGVAGGSQDASVESGNGGAGQGGTGGGTGGSMDGGTGGAQPSDAATDTEPDVGPPICATTAQCEALWANEPCKGNIECDSVTATCKFEVLDNDGDGHSPPVCGGDDCDDSSSARFAGNPEICDGMDNDCDNAIDNNTVCNVPEGPSCSGGLDCGGVSCCENRAVPGGDFMMGRSAAETASACSNPDDCPPDELPEHTVHVSNFFLDTFEVTVGRLRKFIEAYDGKPPAPGAGAHPLIPATGWRAEWNTKVKTKAEVIEDISAPGYYPVWSPTPGANENKPMNHVNWVLAFQFCVWDGGRLPTEAEWEYAASGGAENRVYPWGNDAPSAGHAVYGCLFDGNAYTCAGHSDIANVGSRPLGEARWGHQDLAGSMREHVFDSYDSGWYSNGGAVCIDCANAQVAGPRIIRNGSWRSTPTATLRAARRWLSSVSTSADSIGFRCARD